MTSDTTITTPSDTVLTDLGPKAFTIATRRMPSTVLKRIFVDTPWVECAHIPDSKNGYSCFYDSNAGSRVEGYYFDDHTGYSGTIIITKVIIDGRPVHLDCRPDCYIEDILTAWKT